LNARGNVGRFAEHFASRFDHNRPALDANASDEFRGARAGVFVVQFGERALDSERGANRAFGIVLLRDRVSKQRHQPVAKRLGDTSAHLRHRLRRRVEVRANEIAPILRIELGCDARRAYEIAEHHRDRAALGGVARRRSSGRPRRARSAALRALLLLHLADARRGGRGRGRREPGDRLQ
jgi:hypothetical protein